MTNYVIVGVLCGDEVLIVHKDRPEWQRGRINLPGGKIEEGESPMECAKRELFEETGISAEVEACGLIQDKSDIHVFRAYSCEEPQHMAGETEKVEWVNWSQLVQDGRLIPNLRVIIPLLQSGVKDWVIIDQFRSSVGQSHGIQILVPTYGLAQT